MRVLREQREEGGVSWTHDAEMAAIKRGDVHRVVLLSDRDDARVSRAQRQIGVLLDEVGDTACLVPRDRDQFVDTVRHITQEVSLGLRPARL